MAQIAVHIWYCQYSNPDPTSDLTYHRMTYPEYTPTLQTQLSP
jgi:hypothetical protein